ncbi:MAG: hypothetical protein E7642_02180 [Ruminococcaceae bacterium]|nr:hypothetical protein [Oscillospiraceae bacterium]
MIKKLLFFSLFILIIYMWMTSCSAREAESEEDAAESSRITETVQNRQELENVFLEQSIDAGQKYIDSFVFLGESTTYHLKSRGVLSGGTATKQVWGPKSGTLMLDPSTAECRIVYPETEEEIDLYDALKLKEPKYLLLTFGLNGAAKNISKGEKYFKSCYQKLTDTVKKASPNTKIILQSCFPVAKNMDMNNYSIDYMQLNGYIDKLNLWTSELARENGFGYLNTSEILKNEKGALRDELQSGDGYHLTRTAYEKILYYIRTHAVSEAIE